MSLKSVSIRAANAVLAAAGSESARVATAAGCLSMLEEFQKQKDDLQAAPGFAGMQTEDTTLRLKALGYQEREIRRVLLRRKIEEESSRVDRDNKRELDAAEQEVKVLETERSRAAAALSDAEQKAGAVKDRINGLQMELDAVRVAAQANLDEVRAEFQSAFDGDGDEEKERAAAKALQQAQTSCGEAGAEIALRIEGLTHQHMRLTEAVETARAGFLHQRKKLAEAMFRRHEIRSDIATKAMADALLLGLTELDEEVSLLPSYNEVQLKEAAKQKLHFYGEHRFPVGGDLIHGNALTGMDDLIAAFLREPDLDLLFGRKDLTASGRMHRQTDHMS